MSFDGFRDCTSWLRRGDESADDVHHDVSNVLAAAGDDFNFNDTFRDDIAYNDTTRDASGNDVHCGDRYNASALGVYRSIDTCDVDD